jgi:hypothetical protein
MSLRQKLDETRAASKLRIPSERYAVMQRATEELRSSGILDYVVSVGEAAPAFTGPSHTGATISSNDLLGRGPLVLSFFRGHW